MIIINCDWSILHNDYAKHKFSYFSRGWEQLEVSCNPTTSHENNLWNVESHENDRGNPRHICQMYVYV